MLAYAQLTPGHGFRPWRASLYYAQRLMIWPAGRQVIASALSSLVNLRYGRAARVDSSALHELAREGVAKLPDLLSRDEITEMRRWLDEQPNDDGVYSLKTSFECPYVRRVIADPRITGLIASYLGCKPTLSSIGIRWSKTADKPPSYQSFHRDPDDWRFVKVFVYLTDVSSLTGPHSYVRRSHLTKTRFRAKPYGLEEVQREYGQEAVWQVLGAAGTSFIADTYGIHRGDVPVEAPRLILQLQFSICEILTFLYPKVAHGLDRYTGRLFS